MNVVSFFPTFKLNISSTKVGIRTRFDAMQNVVIQRKRLFQGGDAWNTSLLHLLLHQRRSWTALFCIFRGNKKIPIFIEKSGFYVVLLFFAVVPPGIEPGTQGLSVLCSTNWAMAPLLLFCECKGNMFFFFLQVFGVFFLLVFALYVCRFGALAAC